MITKKDIEIERIPNELRQFVTTKEKNRGTVLCFTTLLTT